jgi:HlyD family secretion protein
VDGRARLQRIVLGVRYDEFGQVPHGVGAGSQVIPYPNDRVADGVAVMPRADPDMAPTVRE